MVATSGTERRTGWLTALGQPAPSLDPSDRWLRQLRMVVLEQHEYPVWRDPREVVDLVLAANGDAIRWPTVVWAATFFDSDYLPKHPAAAGRDFLQEILDAAEGTGIQVIPYMHLGVMHRETFAVHPDWAARDALGAPNRWNNLHYNSCLSNGDVLAAYAGAVAEVVRRYPVPALYFDGPSWYGRCFCERCQAAFETEWGYALPPVPSYEDDSHRHYNESRFRRVISAMETLQEAIAGSTGDRRVPAMFNTGMRHSHSRRNGSVPERVMAHAEGCLSTEVHRRTADEIKDQGGSFLGILETVHLGASLRRTALCYTPPGPYESLVTHDSLDTPLLGASYLALGGTPVIETARSYLHDRTGLPAIRRLYEEMERGAPLYYDAIQPRRVVVLCSRQTAEHRTGDDIAMAYERHFSGMVQALTHDHQSFGCLYDWHLCPEELDGVAVLVLPNAACLSDAQIETIRAFVAAGGGLVATANTSLYDERGHPRGDLGLADLFGLRWIGHAPDGDYGELQYREGDGYREVPEGYFRLAHPEHEIAAGLPTEQLIPVTDAWWVGGNVRPVPDYLLTQPLPRDGEDRTVVADLYLPAGGRYGQPFDFPLGQPAGIVAKRYGAGRVVYIASGISQHYGRRGIPALRRLLNNAVDWAAASPRPVRLSAPVGVFAHLTSFAGQLPALAPPGTAETLALHLVNYTGAMHEASAYRVEYVAPLAPFTATFTIPAATHVIGASQLIGGASLPFTRNGDNLAIEIAGLGTHETVLVHLGPPDPTEGAA